MKHIPSLDGIRGLAVLLVVAFHYIERRGTGVLGIAASAGWIGVDIFLVLSGYLITSILFEQRGSEHFFRNFYIRRALRLFPLYYFILAIILIFSPLLHIHWQPAHLAFLFYSANYVMPFDHSLAAAGPFNLFHTWTLSLEEQFYLLWPWLVGNLALSRKRLIQICIAGMIIAPIVRFVLLSRHLPDWLVAGGLPTRMDTLLLGSALALIPLPSLRTAKLVAFITAVLMALVVWWAHSLFFLTYPMQTVGYSVLAFLCASILVLSRYPTTFVCKLASLKTLRFYGRYSYGLYLWHYLFSDQFWRIRGWFAIRIPNPLLSSTISFFIILSLSTLIAVASYRLIEERF